MQQQEESVTANPSRPSPRSREPDDDLRTCERLVVLFVQLKDYMGSYWLAPWFFVYIYPSVLLYETHGYFGPFVYCNIVQILFFIAFEFWDESFNWTPLHDSVKTYSSRIFGRQHFTKNVDELILFCTWVFSWAAVPTVCLINGHIFELPSDRIERLTSYVYMMSATFVIAYIFVLLWIDMNSLEANSSVITQSASANVPMSNFESTVDIIEPENIPDLNAVYEDFSITQEFRIENAPLELTEALNKNTVKNKELFDNMQIEQGEEATEQEIDVISLSSSTLSEFDVITDEEINLLNH